MPCVTGVTEQRCLRDFYATNGGEDTRAYSVRHLAHWATISSWPIGAFQTWKLYGIDPQIHAPAAHRCNPGPP